MILLESFRPLFLIILEYLVLTGPYWVPIFLLYAVWKLFRFYIEYDNLTNMEWVLLEIKLPKEVRKSPLAMEVVLASMHQTNQGNLVEHFLQGQVRPWFSLEMVSIGGEIKFFIRCLPKFKNILESEIYSQYPGIEVTEAEDYVEKMPYGIPGHTWDYFGIEFKLSKEDPYPIKTYIDYGLERDDKEDFKVDPMSPVLEIMSTLKPGEQMWLQIPIMASKKKKKPGTFFGHWSWKDEGEALVDQILKRDPNTKGPGQMSEAGFPILPTISKVEQGVAESIQRGISKLGFDCGMRMYYFAKEEEFVGTNISAMLSSIKQYNSPGLNGFEPYKFSKYEYFWQDPFGGVDRWKNNRGPRSLVKKAAMFDAYRKRSYFYFPYIGGKKFTLSTEELATIFHFPGETSSAPALPRIESTRGKPPTNLPI